MDFKKMTMNDKNRTLCDHWKDGHEERDDDEDNRCVCALLPPRLAKSAQEIQDAWMDGYCGRPCPRMES